MGVGSVGTQGKGKTMFTGVIVEKVFHYFYLVGALEPLKMMRKMNSIAKKLSLSDCQRKASCKSLAGVCIMWQEFFMVMFGSRIPSGINRYSSLFFQTTPRSRSDALE